MRCLATIITTICVILIHEVASMYQPPVPIEFGIPPVALYSYSENEIYNSFKRNQEVNDAVEHHRKTNKLNERGLKVIAQPLCSEERVTLRIGANDRDYDYLPKTINLVKCNKNKTHSELQKFECRAEHCVNTIVLFDLFRKPKNQPSACWEFVWKMPVSVACECQALVAEYHSRPKKPYPSSQIEGRDLLNVEDFS